MRILERLWRRPAPPFGRDRGAIPCAALPIETSLPDILRWARSFEVAARDWLVLGKGPSYDLIDRFDLSGFYTCSLNHVVRERAVDLAHIIDIDVVEDVKDVLQRNARFLAMPYFPHVKCFPTAKTLDEFAREIPVLRSLRDQGRLIWYNLSVSGKQVGGSPVIDGRYFSAEAAVQLLATCGAARVRSLGVDGGGEYAARFRDLSGRTLLSNRHPSFDLQFEGIARAIRRHRIFYAPLHREAPVRVFIGADATQAMALRVLEYSIEKRASMSVDLVPMRDLPVPLPRDPRNRPRSGFSFARFLIPSLCGYRGRAIYLDADMLVFDDLVRLWEFPLGGAHVLHAEPAGGSRRPRRFSVLLLDCANLTWRIEEVVRGLDEGRYDYQGLVGELCPVPPERVAGTLPPEWNSLERYRRGRTRLIHFADMHRQPWVSARNPNRGLWYEALREGIEEGFIRAEEVYREVERGHVLPDLPQRAGLPPHPEYGRLSRSFVPHYKKLLRV